MTNKPTPLPDCDCLGYCGDDPRIDRGLATPCLSYCSAQAHNRLHNAAPLLLAALRALIQDQRDASLPVLAQARQAIFEATGKHP